MDHFLLRCAAPLLCLALTPHTLDAGAPVPGSWTTRYERSGGLATSRYQEDAEFCRRLARVSPLVRYASFGRSSQGRPLPLVIAASGGAFDPESARRQGKAVVLVQAGIHAGEIDGKDAGLLLIRDIALGRRHRELLAHAVLLFVPIFNVDGHERFGPFNRINQNGPLEMGWRVTAQNLNLNRDYMKADTPEMRAMLRLFAAWLPDLLVDCHVTDGIDFQYDLTYAMESGPNIDSRVALWLADRLLPEALAEAGRAGHKVFPYVFPREDNDLSQGLRCGAATPRFSTGYAALQNRPAVLIETHMLKPYRTRVEATSAFLVGILRAVNASAAELRRAVTQADRATVAAGTGRSRPFLPLRFGQGPRATMREFLGIEARRESSAVSGGMRTIYTGRPVAIRVPFFNEVTVEDSAAVPAAYAVPSEWTAAIAVLRAHGLQGKVLAEPVTVSAESYRFPAVKFRELPYEGRHTVTCTAVPGQVTCELPAGTLIVPTAQRAGKVLMHLLEPQAPDALLGWGFFSAIFEQKEYAEAYVMEAVADTMLRSHPGLKAEYEEQLRADSAFARSAPDRLNWLYLRSPWGDPAMNAYPVARLMDPDVLARLMKRAR